MGRTYVHAPPGPGQLSRLTTIRGLAAHYGHVVRGYPAPEKGRGWIVLVIHGPMPGGAMRTLYDALDHIGLLDDPSPLLLAAL